MTTQTAKTTVSKKDKKPPNGDAAGARAFAKTEAQRRALAPEDVIRPTLDIGRAVQIVFGFLAWLLGQKLDIAKLLPGHMVTARQLQLLALAAAYANATDLPATPEPSETKAMLEQGAVLREDMLASAELLVRRGLLDAEKVAAIRSGKGQTDAANDLIALGALFRESWTLIHDKSPITAEDVARAASLGMELLKLLGQRDRRDLTETSANERARAFTLLATAYDEWRRAIGYLRWHEGDAETVAPSLWKLRARRPSSDASGAGETPTAEVPAAEPPNGGGTVA